jgi:hypothetical protein
MVDLTITAANVVPGADAVRESGTAGEAITAGRLVYFDVTTLTYRLAKSNGAAALRVPNGIALNTASAGQPVVVQNAGDVTLGAVMTAGVAYLLSDTSGGICPDADVGTGEFMCLVGVAKSTSVLKIGIIPSGVSR